MSSQPTLYGPDQLPTMILEVLTAHLQVGDVVMEGGIFHFLQGTYGRGCCTQEALKTALVELKRNGYLTEHLIIGGVTDWRILRLSSTTIRMSKEPIPS